MTPRPGARVDARPADFPAVRDSAARSRPRRRGRRVMPRPPKPSSRSRRNAPSGSSGCWPTAPPARARLKKPARNRKWPKPMPPPREPARRRSAPVRSAPASASPSARRSPGWCRPSPPRRGRPSRRRRRSSRSSRPTRCGSGCRCSSASGTASMRASRPQWLGLGGSGPALSAMPGHRAAVGGSGDRDERRVLRAAIAGRRRRPGERVSVQLPLTGAEQALVVPTAAVVYDLNGGTWVYEATGATTFARRRVEFVAGRRQDAGHARHRRRARRS